MNDTTEAEGAIFYTAERACNSCRVQKRKCDKLLPSCSLCSSRSWKCDYLLEHSMSYTPHSAQKRQQRNRVHLVRRPTSIPTANIVDNPGTASESWMSCIDFPAVFFLDPYIFQKHQVQIPQANLVSTMFYSNFLGDNTAVRTHVSLYFNSIHKWMPIISEERFYNYLEKPLSECPADVAFLLLCMKMITCASSGDPRTEIYLAAKQGFANLETAGILSIRGLQAGLIISIYEIGHAIYPAAFLTIGSCERYGYALGLGCSGATKICRPFSRDELKENIRLWWAVILLHRFINLECPNQSPAIEDPVDNSTIPLYADSQETATANSIGNANQQRRDCGCFVLIVEATKLLGQVYRHLSHSHPMQFKREAAMEVAQLQRTLDSLINASEAEAQKWGVSISDQITICYSTYFALYKFYEPLRHDWDGCPAMDIKAVCDKVVSNCKIILFNEEFCLESISPLLLHSIYATATSVVDIDHSTGQMTALEEKQILTSTLRLLGRKWRLARTYLEILEAREIIN